MVQPEPVPDIDKAELAAILEPKLRERRVRYIPGAQLAPLINDALPDGLTFRAFFTSAETPRLRTFVERYLPRELVHATEHRQGSDVLFELNYLADAAAVLTQHGNLWRSFVAVDPISRLVYDPKTASIAALNLETATPEGCLDISRVSLMEHKQMCEEFSKRIEQSGHEAQMLASILQNFSQDSYPEWLRILRNRRPLDREWGEFRHQALLRLFEQRLQQMRVPPERVVQLREELARDHEAARGKAARIVSVVTTSGVAPPSKDHREKRARELLHAAADKLTLEQLRAVQLPIGVMLDLLSSGDN